MQIATKLLKGSTNTANTLWRMQIQFECKKKVNHLLTWQTCTCMYKSVHIKTEKHTVFDVTEKKWRILRLKSSTVNMWDMSTIPVQFRFFHLIQVYLYNTKLQQLSPQCILYRRKRLYKFLEKTQHKILWVSTLWSCEGKTPF